MATSLNRFLALLQSHGPIPVVIAHRGDSFHAPENTLEAGRLAWQAGADAWEVDVQLTRDGVAVVLHDESLLRTTDVAVQFAGDPRARHGFRVGDFDFDEVRKLDAGSWFVAENGGVRSAQGFGTWDRLSPASIAHYASGQVFIPTLAEALSLTKELDWLVNVEIKSFPERAAGLFDCVLREIEATDTATRVLISSFDHSGIAAAGQPDRRHAMGILTATPLHRVWDYAATIVRADAVHVSQAVMGAASAEYDRNRRAHLLDGDLPRSLDEQGIPLLVFTINDHGSGSLAEHLAEIGADGLFTDDPAGMKRSFELYSSSKAALCQVNA